MRREDELILYTSLIDKSEEEIKKIEDSLSKPIDWGYVIGQLIHHRLTGYFMKGLPESCNRHRMQGVAEGHRI